MRTLLICVFFTILALTFGCGEKDKGPDTSARTPQTSGTASNNSQEAHGHKKSAHGGIIVEVGRDSYHAEALFEKGGLLRLYMLGSDESKVQAVTAQPVTAYVKAEGDAEAVSFVMRPDPQTGDAQGMTSLFIGHLPKALVGKKLKVTIPSIKIGNDRFRIAFKSNPAANDAHGIPDKVEDEAERKLYLTPGGKYTETDIEANGRVTASEKFKGFKADHDLKPKTGEKICPITLTKANPKFTWVVGGKAYEFCCPPCVDEFVALAKEKPSEVQDPETYRKK